MAIHQQRIPLRGSEPSIDLFTSLLREVKENFGLNSADVLLECIRYWHEELSTSNQVIMRSPGAKERGSPMSHSFYVQLLTSTDVQVHNPYL